MKGMSRKSLSRLLPVGGVAVAALLVSQCQIDKLLSPPTGGVLVVTPLALADSAPLGSSAPRTQRVVVGNGASGGITWTATTARSSTWLHLGAATGSTPDTLPVSLVATGLALGTYRDTIVVTGSGSSAGELRVPVQLTVQPCAVLPVAVGGQVAGTVGAASCAAPHRAGHPAALYAFSGSAGDSVSLELTAPAGYLVLDSAVAAAKPALAESGTCLGVAGNPCLFYQRLPRTGSYVVEVSTNAPTDSGAFTLAVSPPRTPAGPTSLTQLDADSVTAVPTGDTISQNALVFRGVVSDPDRPDSLRLEVEAKPTSVPFTGTGTTVGAPAANGRTAYVQVTSLFDDSAYHWRARAVDQTGRPGNWVAYGGNAESAADFVLGNSLAAPTAAGQFKSDGVTALPVGGTNVTRTIIFKGTVADPAQGEHVRLEIELEPLGTAFTNSATVTSVLATSGSTVQATSPVLLDNDGYHWQYRAVSQSGRTSRWQPFGGNAETAADFREALAPQQLVILAQPAADTAGKTIHPAVQVAAQDSLGNTLASFTDSVTMALDSNPGGATLSGGVKVAAVAGVATFPALSLDKTGVGYRLRASIAAPSLSVQTGPFNVTAGSISPSLSTVAAAPATIHASRGDSLATITVTVRDPLGNPVPGIAVVLADTATGDSLRQPAAVTDGSGVATGSVSGKMAGVKHVTASAGGQAITQTATVTILPAHAQLLAFTVEPVGTSAGATLTPAVQVTASDSLGNVDTSYAGNVTVAVGNNPGGSTLSGTTTAAAAHGVATFADLSLDKSGAGYTLTATAANVTGTATSTAFTVSAGTGTKLAFTVQPANAVAGAAITPALQVTAQDGSGNTVTGFTGSVTLAIAANPGGGTLGGTASVNAVAGVATFSSLTLNKAGAGYTLSATASGFTGATSAAFNIRPGAATQLAFTTEPSGAAAGAVLPATVVTALDAFGNPDTAYAGTVTAAIDSNPAGGTLGGTVAVGAVQGVATFSTLTIDKAGAGYRLAATAPALTRARSNAFTISAGGVSASLSTITALPASITAGGTGATVSVTARDAHGNPIAGAAVVLAATGTGNTVTQPATTTDASGLATGSFTSTKAEAKTISATVGGMLITQTAPVTVTPAAISAAQSTLQASPTSVAAGGGSAILTATARDAYGNPISGLTAVLAATGAGNTVTQPPAPTDASGIATGALSSTVAGAKVVSVTIGGVAVTATDTVAVTSGGATHLVFSVEPANTVAGAAITPALQVSAHDANENVSTGFTGNVTVAIGTNPGGGTLSGTATVAAVAGVATFSGLSIDRAGTGYTLGASAGGLVAATSSAFNVQTGAAARLGLTTEPSASAANGVAFGQQPEIQIQDASGNPVSQSGTTVTAALATGAGTLGGTLTAVTDAGGLATFTNLKITGLVGARTLTFTAPPLTAATSGTVTVGAGAPTQIAVNGGDHQTATAGTAVGTPPSVIVTDESGNPVAGVGVTFALPGSVGANGSLTGPNPSTNASGVATVGSWTLGATAKPDSMTATSTGLTGSPLIFVDTAKVGAAAHITKFSGDNLVGQVGSTLSTPHDVLITDANGNPVPNVTVTWAAQSGGSVSPTSDQTDVTGHAQATRTLGAAPGAETTTATATLGGTPTADTFAVTAQVGGATQMKVNAGDRQTDTVGVTLPVQLSVLVQDALNNPVSGVTISWSVLNGGGSVGPLTSVTNASGIASTSWTLGTGMSPVDSTQLVQATGVGSPVTFTAFTVPGAVSAAQTSVTASSPVTASTGSSQSTVTVTARDQYGNVIKGKTVTLAATGTGNTVTNPAAATNENGVATGTLSSTKAESKTVTATVGGVIITQQPAVVVDPAAAQSLTFLVQPSAATAGAAIAPPIQVEILDAFANPVTTASNAVSLTLGNNPGGSTLSGTVTSVAAVNGVASFPTASLNKTGTGYTLDASSSGLAGQVSAAFTVTSGAVSAAQSSVAAGTPITAGGPASTVTVTARDANGNPVAGATVVLAATGSGNTVTQPATTTDASGVATGSLSSTVAEVKTVSATVAGVGVTQTAAVTVNPGAAATMTASAGTGQSATVGTAVTTPPAVIVRDVLNNPVPGVAVTFAVTASNGSVTAATPTTGSNGIATVGSWTLGTLAKTDTLTATSTAGVVTFTAVATPGAADHLVFTQEPSAATAGLAITPAIVVTALDNQGNVATDFAGSVSLAIGTNPGGGALSGTTTVTAAAGVATFSGLSINKSGAGYTLAASSTGVTGATSTGFTVAPGAATQLTFTQEPTDAASGAALSPAVTVTALDADGNVATGFAGAISLAIANNAGAGTLSGGAGVTPVNGVATFAGLSIDKVGTGYTLAASATGVAGATSTGFSITPGAATKLAFTVAPTATAAGASITPAVQVTAQDANGNTATGFSGSVTVAIGTNAGGGTLSGTTAITAAAGMANFSNLSIDKAGVGYTLSASATGLASATSTAFTITPAGASQLAFTVQPVSDSAAGPLGSIQVTARDAFGNTATGFAGTVTLAISTNPGGGTLSGTTGVAASGGVATFPGLSINKAGTGYMLGASSSGLSDGTSAAFTITPGNATHLAFTAEPSTVVAGASIAPAVAVTVLDANNNVVTAFAGADTIRIGTNPGTGALSGDTVEAFASGVASHSALVLNQADPGYTLTARSGTLTGATSTAFAVTAGAVSAAQTTVAATSPITASSGTSQSTITVTARDALGNPVSGATVVLGATGTGNTLTQPGLTDGTGVATGTLSATFAESKTVSATVNGVAITQTATVVVNPGGVSAAQSTVGASSPITASTGASQSTVTVTALDALGNPIAGATVTLAATGTGNTLTQPLSTTNASGVATGTLSSTVAESKTVSATINAVGVTQTAIVVVAPAAPNNLNFVVQPASQTANVAIAPFQVEIRDAFNNRVTTAANAVSLAIGTNPGGGTLSGTVTNVTPVSGVATFSDAAIDKAGIGYTLAASATGLAGATSSAFTITAGTVSAAQSTVTATSPITASSGGSQSTITVTAKDGSGNPIAGATVVLAATGSGNTLTEPVGTTNASGVATGTLSSTVAESKTVSATINSVAITQTAAVVVGPAAASQLVFTAGPVSDTAGGLLGSVVVTALDQFNNTATGFVGSDTIRIGTNPASGVLAGDSIEAFTAGVATHAGLSINKAGAGYTLTARSGTVTTATSPAFNVTAGAATTIAAASSPPATATVGSSVTAPSVLVTDAHGNPVSGVSVTFTLSAGGGAINPASPAGISTDGTGHATLTSWTLGTAPGANTVQAASGTLGGSPVTFTVTGTVGPVSASQSTVTASSPIEASSGTSQSTITVTAKDGFGNVISGATVVLGATGSNNTLSSPPNTDGTGVSTATFSSTTAESKTVSATVNGIGITQTATVVVNAGTATQLVYTTQPSNTPELTNITPAIVVKAEDGFGNVDPTFGSSVSVAIDADPNGGLSDLLGTTTQTAVAGVATFGDLQIDLPGNGFTLQASSGALSVVSNLFNITP